MSGGTSVFITGSGFTGATAVHFGATTAGFGVISDTQIMTGSPAHGAGTVDVIVTAPCGTSQATSADQFTFQGASAPAVTAVRPSSGPTAGGGMVEIDGSGFTGATAIAFGGTSAMYFTVQSNSVIDVQAPAHAAGTVDVIVTAPGGQSAATSADQYTYQAASGPVVTAVTPSSGSTAGGNSVEIDGSGFSTASSVAFGGAFANYSVSSDSVIIAQAPAHAAGVVDVVVTAQGVASQPSSADHYNYVTPPPVVTGVSPDSGTTAGGTSVEISGSGFTGASAVSFGGASATGFTVVGDTEIIATTPAEAAGVADVVVTAFGVMSALVPADHFAFVKPTIQITNTPGAAGNNINISQMAGSQAETTIAINPAAPNHLFAAAVDYATNTDLFAATLDRSGGNTAWSPRIIADGEPAFAIGATPPGSGDSLPRAQADPSVAYDQFGNLFLTYLTPSPTTTTVSQVGLCTTALAVNIVDNSLTDAKHTWAVNEWQGFQLQITAGPGASNQVYTIKSNTANKLVITNPWGVGMTPDIGSKYILLLPQRRVVLAVSTDNGQTFQFLGWVDMGRPGVDESRLASVDQPTVTTGPGTTLQSARNNAIYTPLTLTDPGESWTVNQFAGDEVAITTGSGAGEFVKIQSNTANTLTLAGAWNVTPDAESQYVIRISAASVWVTWGYFDPNQNVRLVAAKGAGVDGLGIVGPLQPIQIINDSLNGEFADPQVGPNGQLLVAYQTDSASPRVPGSIYVANDPDGLGPQGFIVPPGGKTAAASTLVGLHYTPDATGVRGTDAEPTLAWDLSGLHNPGTDGRVYLVYTDVNPRLNPDGTFQFPDDTFIEMTYSDDGGTTWNPPQQVAERTGYSQFLPAAAVDPTTGWLAVSWYDARNDQNTPGHVGNKLSEIFATVADGTLNNVFQVTFVPAVQIGAQLSNAPSSGDNFGFGDYTGLTFYNQAFFPAWSDNSNSTKNNPGPRTAPTPSGPMDVYTAEVDVATIQPPPGGAAPAPASAARPSATAASSAPLQPGDSPSIIPLAPLAPALPLAPAATADAGQETLREADPVFQSFLSVSPAPLSQARPLSGASDAPILLAPEREYDFVFLGLSAGLNPRVGSLWPYENAPEADDFGTDSLRW